jgi:hypothetical protein
MTMTAPEYQYRLRTLITTCAMNQKYHHTLEWRYGMADKVIRIVVGVLAVVGLAAAFGGPDHHTADIWLAVVSLVAALALNIVPVGDREKHHGELFRLWSDLRRDADREELKGCELGDDDKATGPCVERLSELLGKKDSLNATESAPWPKLIARCAAEAHEETGQPMASCGPPPGRSAPAASAAGAGV